MSIKAMQDYTYVSKYARYSREKSRRETWSEAVDRVMDMHLRRFPQLAKEIEFVREAAKQKRVLGSQRALQFGGKPIEDKHARMYNCISAYCDRIRFFQECFWLLLCGCGTGFSVQKHHVAKLPDFSPSVGQKGAKVFTVPDTIEGWADALGVLMATYMPHPEFPEWEGYKVEFDFSQIRPKGSPLASGVGKAPGHEPLQRSLQMIRFLLEDCHGHRSRLRPIDAYDIIMHASDAVLSGGVRRSATLCIFSIDDDQMIKAKTGNWFIENPQRGRSNNSVLLIRNETPKEKFLEIMESVKEFGEPGFIWADDKESLYNPCVTKDTLVTTKDGLFKVGQLIGKQFDALVDGDVYRSTEKGFWKTGDKEVLKLTFESGRTLECTANHQILTADGWKEAGDLTGEDEIFLHNHQSAESHVVDSQSEDYAKGYLLGAFLADGTTHGDQDAVSVRWWGENKAECKADGFKLMEQAKILSSYHQVEKLENKSLYSNISSTKLYDFAAQKGCLEGKKHLSDKAVAGSWSYLAGLVGGYFDADGTVIFNQEKGSSLRIWSTQLDNLQNLQIVLSAFGIQSKIYQDRLKRDSSLLPDGKGGVKEYPIQKAHELVVSRNSIERFHALIPLRNAAKAEAMGNIVESRNKTPYRSTFIDRIVSKESVGVKEVYDCTVPEVSAFDANGVYVHNCVEIALYGYDDQGNSGWQACNLCEINGKKLKTREDFEIAAKAGAILGTIQASYTDFTYLGEVSKRIVEREALLGVSITGMMDNPDLIFDPAVQREMAQLVLDVNEEIAAKIGINKAARATCVKPAGCQRPDTMIVSDKGILSLGEVGIEDGPTWQDHDLSVLVAGNQEKSTKFFVNGEADTLKIQTKTGVELECTPNHQYKVFRNGELVWVRADQIKTGDILPYVVGGYNNRQEIKLEKLKDQKHFNSVWKHSPSVLSENLCWLLGLYTGDGSNHTKGIRIHGDKRKPDDLLKAQKILKELFNLDSNIEKDRKGEGRLTLCVNSVDLLRWLELNGLKKQKSSLVSIPCKVRMASASHIKEFINGYWCADGGLHATNKTRSWVTTSEKMARQLLSCLRAIGQDCSMRLMTPTATSKGTKMRFWIQEKKGRTGNYNKSPMHELFLQLDKANLSDYLPDVVVSIEASRCMTLDIEVPNGHAYRANSYISHNTTSCILGTSSGIHPHHAKRYFRRIQGNALEAPLQFFKLANPMAVEKSVWSANGTDEIITFCVEVNSGRTKNDLSALKLLDYVRSTQQNWVAAGKREEACVKPWLMHNVSNTINVRPEEWTDVAEYIFENRQFFAGISLLPQSGDLDYPQAPFTTVYTPKEIVSIYGDGSLMASGLIVHGLEAFDNNLWAACDAVLGLGAPIKEEESAKIEFLRRAKQFAKRYFKDDMRQMVYCLKCVHNWKLWCDLNREYRDVDYSQMYEADDATTLQETVACAGGSCSTSLQV